MISLVCEGMSNEKASSLENWGGIVFERHPPFETVREYGSVFYNKSKSVLEFVDIRFAGLVNRNDPRFRYEYSSSSAITVFQYSPRLKNVTIEFSAGNGANFSNLEAPALLTDSLFRFNKG